jgi:hypothetical protein
VGRGGAGPGASVQFSDRFANVQPETGVVPAQVRGRVSDKIRSGAALAFALNGRIVATGTTFKPVGGYQVEFASLLPPDSFKAGRNLLDMFAVHGETLTRIGGA